REPAWLPGSPSACRSPSLRVKVGEIERAAGSAARPRRAAAASSRRGRPRRGLGCLEVVLEVTVRSTNVVRAHLWPVLHRPGLLQVPQTRAPSYLVHPLRD